jgi:ligand-binding SRPBCC domain-containing protein
MKIKISTIVKAGFQAVVKGFNVELFNFLLPPKKVAALISYDGEHIGGKVHIRFYLPWKSDWVSRITDSKKQVDEYYFTDTGVILPFGLNHWVHKHSVKKTGVDTTMIVDEMEFSTGNKIFDLMLYPVLYFSFLPRKKLYRKYFEEINT